MTVSQSPEAVPPAVTEAIRQSVVTTFESIIGSRLNVITSENGGGATDGVVGIIGLVGDLAFSVMLGFPRPTAPALVEKFTGFPVPYDSADMGDMVGEFANILAGDLIARLDSKGIKSNMSLPTVVRGSNVEMLLPQGQPWARIRFASECGEFWVKVAFKRKLVIPAR